MDATYFVRLFFHTACLLHRICLTFIWLRDSYGAARVIRARDLTLIKGASTAGAMAVRLLIHLRRKRSYAAAMLRRRPSIFEYVGQNAGVYFSVF